MIKAKCLIMKAITIGFFILLLIVSALAIMLMLNNVCYRGKEEDKGKDTTDNLFNQ